MLLFTDEVDEFVAQTLISYSEKQFCNAATDDLGLQTEEEKKQIEEKAEALKDLLTFVQSTLGENVKEVKLSGELGSAPVALSSATGMSFEMEKYFKRMNPDMPIPTQHILELNPEHKAVKAMHAAMAGDPVKAADFAKVLYCQAQLLAELPLEDPMAYTALVCKLMK